MYNNLEFLGAKIVTDTSRVDLKFDEVLDNNPIFGLGYFQESFLRVNRQTANSWIGLIRNIGIIGFLCYYFFIFFKFKIYNKSLFFIIYFIMISSEPILSFPLFWGIPFLQVPINE